ncbi:hypothetical protein PCE1_002574 [Barthelona sp. PCE]
MDVSNIMSPFVSRLLASLRRLDGFRALIGLAEEESCRPTSSYVTPIVTPSSPHFSRSMSYDDVFTYSSSLSSSREFFFEFLFTWKHNILSKDQFHEHCCVDDTHARFVFPAKIFYYVDDHTFLSRLFLDAMTYTLMSQYVPELKLVKYDLLHQFDLQALTSSLVRLFSYVSCADFNTRMAEFIESGEIMDDSTFEKILLFLALTGIENERFNDYVSVISTRDNAFPVKIMAFFDGCPWVSFLNSENYEHYRILNATPFSINRFDYPVSFDKDKLWVAIQTNFGETKLEYVTYDTFARRNEFEPSPVDGYINAALFKFSQNGDFVVLKHCRYQVVASIRSPFLIHEQLPCFVDQLALRENDMPTCVPYVASYPEKIELSPTVEVYINIPVIKFPRFIMPDVSRYATWTALSSAVKTELQSKSCLVLPDLDFFCTRSRENDNIPVFMEGEISPLLNSVLNATPGTFCSSVLLHIDDVSLLKVVINSGIIPVARFVTTGFLDFVECDQTSAASFINWLHSLSDIVGPQNIVADFTSTFGDHVFHSLAIELAMCAPGIVPLISEDNAVQTRAIANDIIKCTPGSGWAVEFKHLCGQATKVIGFLRQSYGNFKLFVFNASPHASIIYPVFQDAIKNVMISDNYEPYPFEFYVSFNGQWYELCEFFSTFVFMELTQFESTCYTLKVIHKNDVSPKQLKAIYEDAFDRLVEFLDHGHPIDTNMLCAKFLTCVHRKNGIEYLNQGQVVAFFRSIETHLSKADDFVNILHRMLASITLQPAVLNTLMHLGEKTQGTLLSAVLEVEKHSKGPIIVVLPSLHGHDLVLKLCKAISEYGISIIVFAPHHNSAPVQHVQNVTTFIGDDRVTFGLHRGSFQGFPLFCIHSFDYSSSFSLQNSVFYCKAVLEALLKLNIDPLVIFSVNAFTAITGTILKQHFSCCMNTSVIYLFSDHLFGMCSASETLLNSFGLDLNHLLCGCNNVNLSLSLIDSTFCFMTENVAFPHSLAHLTSKFDILLKRNDILDSPEFISLFLQRLAHIIGVLTLLPSTDNLFMLSRTFAPTPSPSPVIGLTPVHQNPSEYSTVAIKSDMISPSFSPFTNMSVLTENAIFEFDHFTATDDLIQPDKFRTISVSPFAGSVDNYVPIQQYCVHNKRSN